MKNILTMSLLALFCVVMVSGSPDAHAKRFGMGSSFGKSFSRPHVTPAPKPGLSQKAGNTGKTAARGGMMGMLGGLAMGGLLGALLFGGAFDGINMMDILLLGGIAFAIFWFMRKKASATRESFAYAGGQQPQAQQPQQDAFTASPEAAQVSAMPRPELDEEQFVAAAKDIFVRMQAAWDRKDMDDIRTFCTPEVASRIALDMEALGITVTRTEVAMLHARILDGWLEADDEWVAIEFTSLLKEETLSQDGDVLETESNDLKETWLFRHKAKTDDPTWYLAGIQQSES